MKVFGSLNCIVCKQPFARVANQPRSPRHLGCGLAMCNECLEEEEILDIGERKHECDNRLCFGNSTIAYFLIDVLSQENALVCTPMGYVLLKAFKVPKCKICDDEYSSELEAKKSFALDCGHIICTECYLKTRTITRFCNKKITCPTCLVDIFLTVDKQKDRFHDFLNELPEMTRQMKAIENAGHAKDEFGCSECQEKNFIDKMFYCCKCKFEICAVCAYKKHRLHEAIPLLKNRAEQMLLELQEDSLNVIKTYEDLVPELHKELFKDIVLFRKKLLSKGETLKEASNFADLREKYESFTKVNSTFESFAEDFWSYLFKFHKNVRGLIQSLDETSDAEISG